MYQPLQPAAGNGSPAPVVYREFTPSEALRPYVYCYWELRCQNLPHARIDYRIVSDGCIDLFINCSVFEQLHIAGTTRSATVVSIDSQAAYFGIRFLPGRFSYFFSHPLKELVDNMIPCSDVWGHLLETFESQLFNAPSTGVRVTFAESFLLGQLTSAKKVPDARFLAILDSVFQHHGQIRFNGDSIHGISPRQLRRIFDRHVGVSPKAFARIVRFQSAMQHMLQVSEKEWGQRCLDFGYYDQAHFIHEFKTFFGIPPLSANFLQK